MGSVIRGRFNKLALGATTFIILSVRSASGSSHSQAGLVR